MCVTLSDLPFIYLTTDRVRKVLIMKTILTGGVRSPGEHPHPLPEVTPPLTVTTITPICRPVQLALFHEVEEGLGLHELGPQACHLVGMVVAGRLKVGRAVTELHLHFAPLFLL